MEEKVPGGHGDGMLFLRHTMVSALAYFLGIFALGFALGWVRTVWLAPAWGPLRAVAAELPVMLLASWLWAGTLLRRRPPHGAAQALATGALALALLLGAELALAVVLAGQSPAQWGASLATAPGALGLAGQLLFALMPWAWWRWG